MFDFDGTLVDTAALKRQAFYALFPATEPYASVVSAELAADPDGSRHAVIPRMVGEMERRGLRVDDMAIEARIGRYGDIVARSVSAAPSIAGAQALLERCHHAFEVHVSSATPVEALQEELQRRGWLRYLSGVHGYPARKPEVLARLMAAGGHQPSRTLVIGDGISDEEAARANGAAFHRIVPPADLAPVARLLEV